jgi:hypothetical protein
MTNLVQISVVHLLVGFLTAAGMWLKLSFAPYISKLLIHFVLIKLTEPIYKEEVSLWSIGFCNSTGIEITSNSNFVLSLHLLSSFSFLLTPLPQ